MQLREQIDVHFPEYLNQAARDLNARGPAADRDAAAREVHASTSLAIDDITTSEVDDAVSVEPLPQGGWRVTVHVADPSAILRTGEPLDLEALKRCAHVAARLLLPCPNDCRCPAHTWPVCPRP